MPISDLSGTTWTFNNSPYIPFEDYYDFIYAFRSNNADFTSIYVDGDDGTITYSNSSTQTYIVVYQNGAWVNEAYKTIEITEATSSATTDSWNIQYLTENATQVVATPSLNFGGSDVTLFLGSSYVSKVYLGSTLLYEMAIPNNAILTADNTYLVDSTGGYLLTTEI